MGERERKSELIACAVTPGMKQRVRREARAAGITMSEFTRRGLLYMMHEGPAQPASIRVEARPWQLGLK